MKNLKNFNEFLNEHIIVAGKPNVYNIFKNADYFGTRYIEDIGENEHVDNLCKDGDEFDSPYDIFRTLNNEYFILKECEEIVDFETEEDHCYDQGIDKEYVKIYSKALELIKDFVEERQSYDFQKKFLIEHPERVDELVPFGFNDKIKQEFPALVRGTEWGFFDLKESLNIKPNVYNIFKNADYFGCQKVDGTIIDNLSDENFESPYTIWKTKNNEYFIVERILPKGMKQIVDFKKEEDYYKEYSWLFLDAANEKRLALELIKDFVKERQSYEYQKEFLTEHPEKASELAPFGFDEKIKQEFPALMRGNEWGFFDLKESKEYYTWDEIEKRSKESDNIKNFIKIVVGSKGVGWPCTVLKIDINSNIIGFDKQIKYISKNRIIFEDGNFSFIDSFSLEKLKGLYEYLKKKYPDITVGKEWGFFDLNKK